MEDSNRCHSLAPRRFCHVIGDFAHSIRGTAVIETALVAPILAVFLMGTVDVARYGAAQLKVQQGVNRGLELAMQGGPTTSTTTIQSEAATQANVATGNVTVSQSQTCAGVAATWGATCTSGTETRKFITVQVSATFTPTFVLGTAARYLRGGNANIAISKTGTIRIT